MFFGLVALLLVGLGSASVQIVPGATITTAGTNQHMQAHGGGIVEVSGTYYLIGENKLNGSAFQSINCYSSTDLVSWTFVNKVLTLQASGDLGPNRVVERPHVMFNEKTGKWVMWMHIDSSSYGEARAGVATSSSVCGSYTYLGASKPLGFQSRDMNVFKGELDTDGTGYLLTEDRANGLRIDKLSDDYLSVESATHLYAQDYEAPALYKSGDTYFMFASHESGWDPNDNIYCTATNLSGPWSAWATFATSGSKTFSSQTSAVVSINGVVIYMGDRWESKNLMTSTYVWLPLTISGTTAKLTNEVNWVLDIAGGKWSAGPDETAPEAEASTNTISGGAKEQSCSGCSGTSDVGYIGGSAGGTLTFPSISSTVATTTTIRIKYINGDSTQRYANVLVNGVAYVVAFLPTTGSTPGTSTLTVPLKSGSGNVIEFEAYNGGWGPDIDRLMVPVS
ncbi:glycosyl hydrolase family 43 protein [Mollisia scopiformis]|uniref:Glycosyl hydrolase family 43 protein n=1 Tax=Mollisia scopiformis TaxID=149040 RepID=A0A132BB21_MOLSC|nr:glycosyl hydrolase family 43 protein [Mollisia scopiformis]KUJ09620.1 glycosyl hydrolase family 43 protein [Mollisia scopiformis]